MLRPLLLAAVLVFGTVGAHAQDATAGVSLTFSKVFEDATIGPGSVTPLTFTIDYASEAGPVATDLAFTDVLPAGVTIATPAVASTTCVGGSRDGAPPTLSAPDGGGTITFSGGGIGPGETCTVTVHVTSATEGTHMNTSGDLTSSLGNSGLASADLTVDFGRPGFSKSFAPSTVAIGGRSTLTFTIDNSANSAERSFPAFRDVFPLGMEVASPSNVVNTCGGEVTASGSTVALEPLSLFSIGAGTVCTISVDVEASVLGALENVSDALSSRASFFVGEVSSGRAGAVLTSTVAGDLLLTKSFLDDPVPPGGTGTLRFSIQNLSRGESATAIAFTDDLNATLSGLAATALPASGFCGAGSTISGTSNLTVSGASLADGNSCTFDVTFLVPANAATGTYTNTTSAPTATIGGLGVVGTPATADLFVEPVPVLTKEFTDDPVLAGSAVTLEFTITNTDRAQTVSDLAFSDVMEFLPVPASASSVPADGFCGAGSTMSFDPGSNPPAPSSATPAGLSVSGASLPAGGSCTFSLSLDIPLELQPGIYPNTTSEITGTAGGLGLTGPPASDDLEVVAGPTLTKAFSPAIVNPGETTRLSFGLSLSGNSASDATDISFSDDLESFLPGAMVAAGQLPLEACGGTLDGMYGGLTFSGGRLTPGETCEFAVDVAVPEMASTQVYSNTTSAVSSTVGGAMLSSPAASADLEVTVLGFEKTFALIDDPTRAPRLVYRLFNSGDTDASITFFTDNLDGVLAGLSADGANPTRNTCGSSTSGTSFLIVFGGTIPAGGRCAIAFPLTLPADPPPGSYPSTSSALSTNIGSAAPAVALLTIDDTTPAFSKAFSPATVFKSGEVDLVFTIDNTGFSENATGLTFTDALPDGVIIGFGDSSTTCTGGTLTASSGGSTISYSGGSVAADGSCTVTVPVVAFDAGTYDNTTSVLTSSAGESPAATATLTVVDSDVVASKFVSFVTDADGDGLADAGDVLRYTVDIQNLTDGPLASVVFTDTPGANTALVPGTVTTTIGTVTAGNGSSDTSVAVDVGSLASTFPRAEIVFDVEVSATIPESVEAVCNQGTVTASGVRDTFTSDPQFGPSEEPTCLEHDRPEIDAVVTGFEVERGGELRVFATAENTTDVTQTHRLRFVLISPGGERKLAPGDGSRFTLDPGETSDPILVPAPLAIPSDAPAGTYTVEVRAVTIEPPTLVDVETFTFVLPPSMMVTTFDLSEVRPGAGPNPFLRRTTLRFPVIGGADVDLRVFDAAGREITVLVDGPLPEGLHEAEFDGTALPAGVYFWRLTVGTERTTGAVTLVR